MTSALIRLPAISNEVLVRVLGSKNRLMMVLPRRVGTFLMARVEISLNESAVSRICWMSCFVNSFVLNIFLVERSITWIVPELLLYLHHLLRLGELERALIWLWENFCLHNLVGLVILGDLGLSIRLIGRKRDVRNP